MDRHTRSNRGPGMRLVDATPLALLADAAVHGPEDPADGPTMRSGLFTTMMAQQVGLDGTEGELTTYETVGASPIED
jgi:hypothetical protein